MALDLEHTPTPEAGLAMLAIHNVLARQAMGNDTLDAALWKSAFWEDATEDHGWADMNAHAFIDETVPMLRSAMDSTWHQVGLPLITVEGDTARSVACFLAHCRVPAADGGTPRDLVSGGRYVDRLERRGGVWRIARRVSKGDWVRIDPASHIWGTPTLGGHIGKMGTRDPHDPARVLFERVYAVGAG